MQSNARPVACSCRAGLSLRSGLPETEIIPAELTKLLIGYARVSTEDQSTEAQAGALREAGCIEIHEEQASGGDRSRPVLARVLARIRPGETLVVVRIDRLARSLSHLLEVIEGLEKRGAHFRSLSDPIDTASPQGRFTLQILGATAEFERALIRERTKSGLAVARSKGRLGGNPGLRARDPEAIGKTRRGRQEAFQTKLEAQATDWLPEVRKYRPRLPWDDVARLVNARLPKEKHWTTERLKRAARTYVQDGLLEKEVLGRSPRRDGDDRLLALVAGIKSAAPDITLEGICQRLDAIREPTPREAAKPQSMRSRGDRKPLWQVSSVKMLLDRAEARGLLVGKAPPSGSTG